MKKIKLAVLFLIALFPSALFAQLSIGGTPLSFDSVVSTILKPISIITLDSVNNEYYDSLTASFTHINAGIDTLEVSEADSSGADTIVNPYTYALDVL